MLLKHFEYARPSTVARALELLASDEDARLLAGGQSLINVLKQRAGEPELLSTWPRSTSCAASRRVPTARSSSAR